MFDSCPTYLELHSSSPTTIVACVHDKVLSLGQEEGLPGCLHCAGSSIQCSQESISMLNTQVRTSIIGN